MEEHGKTTGAWARAGEIPTCRDPQGETLGRTRVKLPWLQFAMEEHGKTTGAWARAGEIPTCRDPQGETLGRARVKLPWLQFATFRDAPSRTNI
jgi:hypothetical protein